MEIGNDEMMGSSFDRNGEGVRKKKEKKPLSMLYQ
jgi:hypothetical protein